MNKMLTASPYINTAVWVVLIFFGLLIGSVAKASPGFIKETFTCAFGADVDPDFCFPVTMNEAGDILANGQTPSAAVIFLNDGSRIGFSSKTEELLPLGEGGIFHLLGLGLNNRRQVLLQVYPNRWLENRSVDLIGHFLFDIETKELRNMRQEFQSHSFFNDCDGCFHILNKLDDTTLTGSVKDSKGFNGYRPFKYHLDTKEVVLLANDLTFDSVRVKSQSSKTKFEIVSKFESGSSYSHLYNKETNEISDLFFDRKTNTGFASINHGYASFHTRDTYIEHYRLDLRTNEVLRFASNRRTNDGYDDSSPYAISADGSRILTNRWVYLLENGNVRKIRIHNYFLSPSGQGQLAAEHTIRGFSRVIDVTSSGQVLLYSGCCYNGTNRFFLFSPAEVDADADGVLDDSDNCPSIPNPDQADLDGDSLGDACDTDVDGDSVEDSLDNCPLVANSDQLDVDGDLIGDACDDLIDNDADGIANDLDNCPAVPNADQADNDGDLQGDACDLDDDNDGVEDAVDNCSLTANEDQADNDSDNIGDVCDSDDDNDAIEDDLDNCPLVANVSQDDNDGDGFGDVCDPDDDNDAVDDLVDNCPLSFNPDQSNTDGVGAGDACNDAFDVDDDDWENDYDNCPDVANRNQSDFDYDNIGDACDSDVDGDEVVNAGDACELTPLGELVGSIGCSIEQLCPCDAPRQSTDPWKNHGQYVSCMTKAAQSFAADGVISDNEKSDLVNAAAQSSCGY